jgi:site-specific recombinase XerD
MRTALVPASVQPPIAEAIQPDDERPDPAHVAASMAANTRRAYDSDWRAWAAWCAATETVVLPAPPRQLVRYLEGLAAGGLKMSSVRRRLAGIARVHRLAGHVIDRRREPLATALDALARTYGTAKKGRAALMTADVVAMAGAVDRATLRGKRDAAMLLLGFAAALRPAELVGLDFGDIEFRPRDGEPRAAIITIRRSKTDQRGEGRVVALGAGKRKASCPVRALHDWLMARQATLAALGPAFPVVVDGQSERLQPQAVTRLVKRLGAAIGLDPGPLGGHSLRVGCITQGAENGIDLARLQQHAGHAKVETTAGYVRALVRDSLTAKLGL